MKLASRLTSSRCLFTALVLLVGYLSAVPMRSQAQCNTGSALKGFNGVYGKCNGGTPTLQGSFAMVDASQYSSSGDICAAIQAILGSPANANGIVVDARGFNAGIAQNCSDNPWNVSTQPAASVVLLPSGTITISKKWTMPSNARLIGEGPGTTILKASSSFSGADMIDMGAASPFCPNNDCPGISIEHLGLDGNSSSGVSVNGIVNGYSQELGYVNDVAFANIASIGLEVTTKYAADSGPYSNLKMSNIGTCVKLLTGGSSVPLYDTRGIHGLTCTGFSASAGIYLDSASNSLEDIYISSTGGTQDGILIGDSAPAESNVLFNIYGSGLRNVIHISNQTNSNTPPNCPAWASGTVYNVCDLTILGVTKSGGTDSIADDLTSTYLTDANLGMYIVGEPVQEGSANTSIGNSRFTTSLSVPTWLVGTVSPSGISCATGALYSRTSGGTTTIYGCAGGGTSWTAIK